MGVWTDRRESKWFWLGVLNDLKGRGGKAVLIFSVDGLSGAAYPEADVQRCVVHRIGNSMRCVS